MRKADIITALLIIAYCIISMIDAMKLKIGWVKNVGPGGGFLPFWLSLAMGVCALIVLVQILLEKEPSTDPFFKDREGLIAVGKVFFTTLFCVILYVFIGAYFGSIIYIAVYMLYIGKRPKFQTALISVLVPVGIWLMFEYFLKIPLPKGLPFVEDFWYSFIPM